MYQKHKTVCHIPLKQLSNLQIKSNISIIIILGNGVGQVNLQGCQCGLNPFRLPNNSKLHHRGTVTTAKCRRL